MPTINHRGWTFIDEDTETGEQDLARISARAEALANRWSALHAQDEQESFERMSYREDGDEDPMYAGIDLPPSRGDLWRVGSWLEDLARCPGCQGAVLREADDAFWCPPCQREVSLDEMVETVLVREEEAVEAEVKRRQHERRVHDEELRIEMQFCEEQLAALGCRMMRPYEHHNEDERFYEMAESGNYPSLLYA